MSAPSSTTQDFSLEKKKKSDWEMSPLLHGTCSQSNTLSFYCFKLEKAFKKTKHSPCVFW